MFPHDAGTTSAVSNMRFGYDQVFWEWHYAGRDSPLREIQLHGCDLVFVGDKIALKQSFRKVPSASNNSDIAKVKRTLNSRQSD
jgi:hypothetical protein